MTIKYEPTQATKDTVDTFEEADKRFQAASTEFQEKHQAELDHLERLREERNVKLDDAVRALRDEADSTGYDEVKYIQVGRLSVQKKWSSFFDKDRFVALLHEHDLYDKAVDNKALIVTLDVPFLAADAWVNELGALREVFEVARDGKELTPAVTAPKAIGAFATETKEKAKTKKK